MHDPIQTTPKTYESNKFSISNDQQAKIMGNEEKPSCTMHLPIPTPAAQYMLYCLMCMGHDHKKSNQRQFDLHLQRSKSSLLAIHP